MLAQKTNELNQNQTYSQNLGIEIQSLKKEGEEIKKTALLCKNIKTNAKMLLFYTGINKKIFNWILKWKHWINEKSRSCLPLQHFFSWSIKNFENLASKVGKIHVRLCNLLAWKVCITKTFTILFQEKLFEMCLH